MENSAKHNRHQFAILVLGALGVVYGDIGTSPLYTMRECFHGLSKIEPTQSNVLGILSLITWALIIVISIKYVTFVLRADNNGEGGMLALMTLALSSPGRQEGWKKTAIMALGLFGTALLYGDGMITPSISVLSAVEGLERATPLFKPYVVPIALVVLVLLFLIQRRGTSRIGSVFGPIVLVWFVTIGFLGLLSIVRMPSVLLAFNPYYGLHFFLENGSKGFLVLGAVFLAVTGGEALYADMGHFGKRAIQIGWYGVAMPGLLLNYYGQGALLLIHPEDKVNPFYALAPQWAIIPLVTLSTMATIVASQALISGAFSLTRQAVLLGYLPRIPIIHTSSLRIGQIYVPVANMVLMVATVVLVLIFRSSSGFAAAYGVGVTSDMLITTLLCYVVARGRWGWRPWATILLVVLFLVFDVGFFLSALTKLPHGGWIPIAVALSVFTLMTTWRKGRQILNERLYGRAVPLKDFVEVLLPNESSLTRVPGAAIFMSGNPTITPPVFLHNLRYNKVLHQITAVMNVSIADIPHVDPERRVAVTHLGSGVYSIVARYGFMESPNMNEILELCEKQGLHIDFATVGFFIGRENIITTDNPGMSRFRQRLFSFMARNSQGATSFFGIPPNQVVELGVQVQL